jgi:hypothetical protein
MLAGSLYFAQVAVVFARMLPEAEAAVDKSAAGVDLEDSIVAGVGMDSQEGAPADSYTPFHLFRPTTSSAQPSRSIPHSFICSKTQYATRPLLSFDPLS